MRYVGDPSELIRLHLYLESSRKYPGADTNLNRVLLRHEGLTLEEVIDKTSRSIARSRGEKAKDVKRFITKGLKRSKKRPKKKLTSYAAGDFDDFLPEQYPAEFEPGNPINVEGLNMGEQDGPLLPSDDSPGSVLESSVDDSPGSVVESSVDDSPGSVVESSEEEEEGSEEEEEVVGLGLSPGGPQDDYEPDDAPDLIGGYQPVVPMPGIQIQIRNRVPQRNPNPNGNRNRRGRMASYGRKGVSKRNACLNCKQAKVACIRPNEVRAEYESGCIREDPNLVSVKKDYRCVPADLESPCVYCIRKGLRCQYVTNRTRGRKPEDGVVADRLEREDIDTTHYVEAGPNFNRQARDLHAIPTD